SLFKDFVADHETAYVTRCKKAGLVILGRSSSPEFGLNPNTEPRLYGSCHKRRSAACSGSSRHAAGCRWRQTQAKDGVACQLHMWSAAACATRPSCSIAPPDRSL